MPIISTTDHAKKSRGAKNKDKEEENDLSITPATIPTLTKYQLIDYVWRISLLPTSQHLVRFINDWKQVYPNKEFDWNDGKFKKILQNGRDLITHLISVPILPNICDSDKNSTKTLINDPARPLSCFEVLAKYTNIEISHADVVSYVLKYNRSDLIPILIQRGALIGDEKSLKKVKKDQKRIKMAKRSSDTITNHDLCDINCFNELNRNDLGEKEAAYLELYQCHWNMLTTQGFANNHYNSMLWVLNHVHSRIYPIDPNDSVDCDAKTKEMLDGDKGMNQGTRGKGKRFPKKEDKNVSTQDKCKSHPKKEAKYQSDINSTVTSAKKYHGERKDEKSPLSRYTINLINDKEMRFKLYSEYSIDEISNVMNCFRAISDWSQSSSQNVTSCGSVGINSSRSDCHSQVVQSQNKTISSAQHELNEWLILQLGGDPELFLQLSSDPIRRLDHEGESLFQGRIEQQREITKAKKPSSQNQQKIEQQREIVQILEQIKDHIYFDSFMTSSNTPNTLKWLSEALWSSPIPPNHVWDRLVGKCGVVDEGDNKLKKLLRRQEKLGYEEEVKMQVMMSQEETGSMSNHLLPCSTSKTPTISTMNGLPSPPNLFFYAIGQQRLEMAKMMWDGMVSGSSRENTMCKISSHEIGKNSSQQDEIGKNSSQQDEIGKGSSPHIRSHFQYKIDLPLDDETMNSTMPIISTKLAPIISTTTTKPQVSKPPSTELKTSRPLPTTPKTATTTRAIPHSPSVLPSIRLVMTPFHYMALEPYISNPNGGADAYKHQDQAFQDCFSKKHYKKILKWLVSAIFESYSGDPALSEVCLGDNVSSTSTTTTISTLPSTNPSTTSTLPSTTSTLSSITTLPSSKGASSTTFASTLPTTKGMSRNPFLASLVSMASLGYFDVDMSFEPLGWSDVGVWRPGMTWYRGFPGKRKEMINNKRNKAEKNAMTKSATKKNELKIRNVRNNTTTTTTTQKKSVNPTKPKFMAHLGSSTDEDDGDDSGDCDEDTGDDDNLNNDGDDTGNDDYYSIHESDSFHSESGYSDEDELNQVRNHREGFSEFGLMGNSSDDDSDNSDTNGPYSGNDSHNNRNFGNNNHNNRNFWNNNHHNNYNNNHFDDYNSDNTTDSDDYHSDGDFGHDYQISSTTHNIFNSQSDNRNRDRNYDRLQSNTFFNPNNEYNGDFGDLFDKYDSSGDEGKKSKRYQLHYQRQLQRNNANYASRTGFCNGNGNISHNNNTNGRHNVCHNNHGNSRVTTTSTFKKKHFDKKGLNFYYKSNDFHSLHPPNDRNFWSGNTTTHPILQVEGEVLRLYYKYSNVFEMALYSTNINLAKALVGVYNANIDQYNTNINQEKARAGDYDAKGINQFKSLTKQSPISPTQALISPSKLPSLLGKKGINQSKSLPIFINQSKSLPILITLISNRLNWSNPFNWRQRTIDLIDWLIGNFDEYKLALDYPLRDLREYKGALDSRHQNFGEDNHLALSPRFLPNNDHFSQIPLLFYAIGTFPTSDIAILLIQKYNINVDIALLKTCSGPEGEGEDHMIALWSKNDEKSPKDSQNGAKGSILPQNGPKVCPKAQDCTKNPWNAPDATEFGKLVIVSSAKIWPGSTPLIAAVTRGFGDVVEMICERMMRGIIEE